MTAAGSIALLCLLLLAFVGCQHAAGPASGAAATLDARLRAHVEHLATTIGPRHLGNEPTMRQTVEYIESQLRAMGYAPTRHTFDVGRKQAVNVVVEMPGAARRDEVVVIGAHYDTVPSTPGADDNGSGVAGLLELARALQSSPGGARTVRYVFFANEEPPYFHGEAMGSLAYARHCKANGDRVVGMVALEMLGYYSDARGSQRFPEPLASRYPDVGNFIALAGDVASRNLVERCHAAFAQATDLPVQSGAVPPIVAAAVGFSDHWSFWQIGVPALMVTDTAMYRNPHYHDASDTPDTLDYAKMAKCVEGMVAVTKALRE